MITIRQLEIFAAVTRNGSFRQAAESLGISPVAISEQIRLLEQRLGCDLFVRTPGGPVSLTTAGVRAEARVAALLADINDLIDEIGSFERTGRRVINVALHGFLMRTMHDKVITFNDSHQDVEVRLSLDEQRSQVLLDKVNDRRLDLAYFYTYDETEAPGTSFVRDEPLAIFVGPEHPLTGVKQVQAGALNEYARVCLSSSNPLRQAVDRALGAVGAGGGRLDVESDDFGLLLHSVIRNRGFICGFLESADELRPHGLVPIELEPALPPLQVRLASRRSATYDLTLRALIAAIGEAV